LPPTCKQPRMHRSMTNMRQPVNDQPSVTARPATERSPTRRRRRPNEGTARRPLAACGQHSNGGSRPGAWVPVSRARVGPNPSVPALLWEPGEPLRSLAATSIRQLRGRQARGRCRAPSPSRCRRTRLAMPTLGCDRRGSRGAAVRGSRRCHLDEARRRGSWSSKPSRSVGGGLMNRECHHLTRV
jgi:hypothetical protein